MISRISATEPNFKAYRQRFTDEEFQQRVDESLAWAKENIDNSKYFKTRKGINKKLKNNAKGGLKNLATYREIFKKSDFEPFVELFLQDRELVGKVTYLSSTPVQVRTQLPCNFVDFFETLKKSGKAQVKEDTIKVELQKIIEKEKYIEALKNMRYKRLIQSGQKEPHPFVLYYDSEYNNLVEKLIKIVQRKDEIIARLDVLKQKLVNKQFKLKLK